MKKYVECGSCGEYHRADYWGDCRNDAERFDYLQLEEMGFDVYEDVYTIEEQLEDAK
jgi:hypothetical protein